jgi:GWxTD domain-containing protein
MRPTRRIVLVSLLAVMLEEWGLQAAAKTPSPAAPGSQAEEFDAPTAEWCDGPVRYVLPQDDKIAYRKLETTEERARFIRRFWGARDPDRGTTENEYRDLFMRRLGEAQRLFTSESTKPGWKTDRGKLWILLGPPDEQDDASPRSIRPDVINWIYRNPPPGSGGGVNVQVRFVLDASGEYRLVTGARLFASDSAMSQAFALQALQLKAIPSGPAPTGESAPEGTSAAAPPGFRAHADVFASGKDRLLAILTLFVPDAFFHNPNDGAAPPRIEVTARLVSDPPGGPSYDLTGAASLRTAPGPLGRAPDGARIYQGGLAVRPGTYKVRYALVGPGAETLRFFDDTLQAVVASPARLAVGPISFAQRLERLAEPAASEYVPPFVLGALRVVPRAEPIFSPDEDLSFYYQVSGAMNDPIGGVPDLEVEYVLLIEGQSAAGVTTQPLGHPIHLTREPSLLQAFSLPLAGWQAGRYRLQVHVTDNLNGGVAGSEIAFQVR